MSTIRRGEIYLVNFGKKYNSEFGKTRPALIIQNDIANRNIDLSRIDETKKCTVLTSKEVEVKLKRHLGMPS